MDALSFDILLQIPDLKKSHLELRSSKHNLNRKRNMFKRFLKLYDFVIDIISPTIDDTKLEYQVIKLFKNIGYKAHKPSNTRDVDGIVKMKTCTLGIEVKNSRFPEENELFQALKYCERNKTKGNFLHPIIIWNNAKTNQNFDKFRIEDAINNHYGLLTTKELLKGFIKLKQNKIYLDNFEKIISRTGNIKFSNKAINESG